MVDLPLMDWRALAYLLVLCLAVTAAWLAGRVSVKRRYSSFYKAVERWRHGDLQTRVTVSDPGTPIGHLSTTFNDIISKLSQREAERESVLKSLREGEERLQIAQDVAGLGIWDWDHS